MPFPPPQVSYGAAVILHMVFGALLAVILVQPAMRLFRGDLPAARAGWSFLLAGAAIGLALVIAGTPRALHNGYICRSDSRWSVVFSYWASVGPLDPGQI